VGVATIAAGLTLAGLLAATVSLYPAEEVAPPRTVTGPPPITTARPGAAESALKTLRKGNIAFRAPAELGLDEQGEVLLVMSIRQSVAQLKRDLAAIENVTGAQILISDVMTASLTGLEFDIEEITPSTQVVLGRSVTRWQWNIAPTKTGTRRLHLTLSALININGSEKPYTVQTFEATLAVRVTWPERISEFTSENWQWLWTTLLFPLAVLVWRRSTKDNAKSQKKPVLRTTSKKVKRKRK
jgi:hypothetical protein